MKQTLLILTALLLAPLAAHSAFLPADTAVMQPGVTLFTNRSYVLQEVPDRLRGLSFLQTMIDGMKVECRKLGTVYALTPALLTTPGCQEAAILQQGFEKLSDPVFQLFPGEINRVSLYRKQVREGDRFSFRKMVVLVNGPGTEIALVKPVAAVDWAKNDGDLLYNGIRLPRIWPPEDRDETSDEPMPVPYLVHPPEVIPIDVGRQLFVDDFLIEQTDMQRTFHRPERFAGNPVFKPESPDELKLQSWVLTGNGGVFFDPTGKIFKLFYTAGWRGGLALATSKDMHYWTRPDLGTGSGNLLLPAGVKWSGGPTLKTAGSDNCVWLDLSATNPAERLKYMTCWLHVTDPKDRPSGFHHTLHVSADGRAWAPEARTTIAAHDYSTFFFNPFRKVWVFSIRYNNDTSRARRRKYAESKDFMGGADWSKAVYWTSADRLDVPEPAGRYPGAGDLPQLYSLNAVAYESLMVGMHYIHRGPSNEIAGRHRVPKLIDLELGFSRDGFHWDRPDRGGFIAGTRKEGDWDRGYLLGAAGVFVVLGDKLVFPYTGCSGLGPDGARGIYTGGSIGLAMLRRDGFASMDAGEKTGTLTTQLLTFKGRHLFVNLDNPRGELRAEVLDSDGNVAAPFTVENCVPLRCDKTHQRVTWQGADSLAPVSGKKVRLRFLLKNGSLYSFWVTPEASGASHGYVAAGGPGFEGVVDTRGAQASLPNTRDGR